METQKVSYKNAFCQIILTVMVVYLLLLIGYYYNKITLPTIYGVLFTLGAIILWRGPLVGLYIFALVFPVGQLIKLPIFPAGQQSATIMTTDFILIFIIASWVIHRRHSLQVFVLGLSNDKITLAALSFFLFSTFSLVLGSQFLTPKQFLFSFLYIGRFLAYFFLYLILLDQVKTHEDVKFLAHKMFIGMATIAVIGVIQYFSFPNLDYWKNENIDLGFFKTAPLDPHVERIYSTFLDPNFLSGYFAFYLVMVAALFVFAKDKKYLVYYGMLMVPFVLTYSRAGYFCLLASLGMLAILSLKYLDARGFFKVLICLAISIMVIGSNDRAVDRLLGTVSIKNMQKESEIIVEPSANQRLVSWGQAVEIAKRHPIIGVGYNAYKWALIRYSLSEDKGVSSNGAQNSFLTIMATTGVIGLVLFVSILFFIFRQALKSFKQSSGWFKGLSGGLAVGLGTLILHAQFIESLTYPQIISTLWIFVGLVVLSLKLGEQVNESRY